MKNAISLNESERLFVISCGTGYSCLGFDVCHDWTTRIANELGRADLLPTEKGTLAAYAAYQKASDVARQSGKRLTCMLTPQLIGLEGKRVEVILENGEKSRFIVGKSTGWMPIHLEIKQRRSNGGASVYGAPFKSVRVVA